MRNSMTAVLERDEISGHIFTTEPYEVAWASEARWFVRTLDFAEPVERVDFAVQVSPDGLHWCDIDKDIQSIDKAGVVTWATRDFGGWLRLRAIVSCGNSPDPSVPSMIYLALKA